MKTRIAPLLLALCSLAATRTAHAQAELTGTYTGGLETFDATGQWATPYDPGGVSADIGVNIVLGEPSLLAGASTTFTIYYVWGANAAEVETRFDTLGVCRGLADGTACTTGGVTGLCRASTCCTGCWSGTSCASGTSATTCGVAGELCTTCNDGNACTTDTCTSGATCTGSPRSCSDGLSCTTDFCSEDVGSCISAVNPGSCVIGGACVADGTVSPTNVCVSCQPPTSISDWSPTGAGLPCDDGGTCTTDDVCNGAGACSGAPRDCGDGFSCTTDLCNELTDSCANALDSGNCIIDGNCYAAGESSPDNDCVACNPMRSATNWSFAAEGSPCEDGDACTVDACGTAGSCLGSPLDCDDGVDCTADSCAAGEGCVNQAPADTCVIDGECVDADTPRPDSPCEACRPGDFTTGWSPIAAGERCGDPSCSSGMLTRSATCDDAGACVPGQELPCDDDECADDVSCSGTCANDADCPAAEHCAALDDACQPDLDDACQPDLADACQPDLDDACQPDLADGEPCDRASVCVSGSCEERVCTPPLLPAEPGGCGCHAAGGPTTGDLALGLVALLLFTARSTLRRRRPAA